MGTNSVRRDETGEAVSANVKRLRKERNLGLRGLATKLVEVGHPLGHGAVDQIERGTRRVGVDDLVALAKALGVSPITLLIPGKTDPEDPTKFVGWGDNPGEMVALVGEDISVQRLWLWLRADMPLPSYGDSRRKFFVDARPEWDPGLGDPGRRYIDDELLSQVAEVYRSNFDRAPAEAVARTFSVKARMAHEYVRRARERGFLPPTTQGKKKA